MENSQEASKLGDTPAGALDAVIGGMGLNITELDEILSLRDQRRFAYRETGHTRLIVNIERVSGGWVVTDFAACDSTMGGR